MSKTMASLLALFSAAALAISASPPQHEQNVCIANRGHFVVEHHPSNAPQQGGAVHPWPVGFGAGECACVGFTYSVDSADSVNCEIPCKYTFRFDFGDCEIATSHDCYTLVSNGGYGPPQPAFWYRTNGAPECCGPAGRHLEHPESPGTWYSYAFQDVPPVENLVEVPCGPPVKHIQSARCPANQRGALDLGETATCDAPVQAWACKLFEIELHCVPCGGN